MIGRKQCLIGGCFTFILIAALAAFIIMPRVARAAFTANDVIDDVVFQNENALTAAQINSFLNSFPNSCISTNAGFTTPDPTGYSSSVQTNLGFTFGGNVTAGQAIYDAAHLYNVNPEVILATMQKEQSVVTGGIAGCHYTNPSPGSACTYGGGCVFIAMSYACPGGCKYSYNGFSMQLTGATWQLRFNEERAEGITSGYAGYESGDSSAGYAGPMVGVPYVLSDGNTITVQNGATASLYSYTPFFSGNENFETIFQDWFGPTTMADSYFAVVCDPNTTTNPGWYLLTANGKYLLTGAIYSSWNLAAYYPEPGCGNVANTVSTTFFNALPTGTINNLLKDQYGNYFFIDNGQIHYISNPNYLSIWGLNPSQAVQSTGLVYSMLGGNWVEPFMTDPVNGNGQIWLMDGGTKHLVPSGNSMLYQWGYTASELTDVSTAFLSSLSQGSNLTQFVSSGGSDFVVDSGQVYYFSNSNVQNAFMGQQTPISLTSIWTLSMLPLHQASSPFVEDASTGQWYMLDNGSLHPIANIQIAYDWGYQSGQPLLTLSDPLIGSFTNAGALSYLVQTSASQEWVVDGSKHLIPDTNTANAWDPSGTTVPTYSTQSLALLNTGVNASATIQPQGSPFVYTLDNGSKRYLPISAAVSAWETPSSQTVALSSNLVNLIPELPSVSVDVQNSGNYYLLMNGTAYQVNASIASDWGLSSSSTQIANSTLARLATGPEINTTFFQVGGKYYIMNDAYAIPVVGHLDAYGLNSTNTVTLPQNFFATLPDASYLVQSTNPSNASMWLISNGQKYLFSSFAQEATYGYVSQGASVTSLDPEVLNEIPTASGSPSLLINTTNAGVKLLSFGYALGFPDANTLSNYTSVSNPVMTVSPSVYNEFSLKRTASIIIQDDTKNDYVMQDGQKDLIQSPSLLQTTYAGVPVTYLEGTTMATIPSGSPVN